MLNVPLQVIWFEGFERMDGRWVSNNIMRRTLTAKDFSDWYSDNTLIVNGVIPPKSVAVNACNWHGSNHPILAATKWAYKALDPSGREYYTEIVLEQQMFLDVQA